MPNLRSTPDHVIFTDTLLAVPKLPALFGQINWPPGGTLKVQEGSWMDEGDPVASFSTDGWWFDLGKFGEIRSPIPGRLVCIAPHPFGPSDSSSRKFTNFYFIVEVPMGVQCPSTLEKAFSHFCSSVAKHRKYLFQKRREQYFPEVTDDEIDKALSTLRYSQPVMISKSEDNYKSIIDTLDVRYPHGIGRGLG